MRLSCASQTIIDVNQKSRPPTKRKRNPAVRPPMRTSGRHAVPRRRSSVARLFGDLLLVLFVAPALIFVFYRVVPPPVTPLMLIRVVEGYGLTKDWVSLSRISPNLQRAVIASEDAKFCQHSGFDWKAVDNAIERNAAGLSMRGASTISMQTSKNLLLWPARNFVRKAAEAYLTVWLEAVLPKRRILELYLNEIEWGSGSLWRRSGRTALFWCQRSATDIASGGTHGDRVAQSAQLASKQSRSMDGKSCFYHPGANELDFTRQIGAMLLSIIRDEAYERRSRMN